MQIKETMFYMQGYVTNEEHYYVQYKTNLRRNIERREEGSELIVVCSPARAHSILLMRSICMLDHVKNVTNC